MMIYVIYDDLSVVTDGILLTSLGGRALLPVNTSVIVVVYVVGYDLPGIYSLHRA